MCIHTFSEFIYYVCTHAYELPVYVCMRECMMCLHACDLNTTLTQRYPSSHTCNRPGQRMPFRQHTQTQGLIVPLCACACSHTLPCADD